MKESQRDNSRTTRDDDLSSEPEVSFDINRNEEQKKKKKKASVQSKPRAVKAVKEEPVIDYYLVRAVLNTLWWSLLLLGVLLVAEQTRHSSPQLNDTPTIGGWRLARPEDAAMLEAGYNGSRLPCNVERVNAEDLTAAEFNKRYRLKKPVIVRFRDGARSWTEPEKWTPEWLKNAYGQWKMLIGISSDIVKRGGNGDIEASLTSFVDFVMQDDEQGEPAYVFDRRFYNQTELPRTLHMPEYFVVNETLEDNIFFLGSSKSGVSFHKHPEAWNGVVYGRKRWFMYPPDKTPPGGVWLSYGTLEWYNRIYPHLKEADRPIECIQEAGEVIYVPESYYHSVVNIGDTIAIGIQKKKSALQLEDLFFQSAELEMKRADDTDATLAERSKEAIKIYLQLAEMVPQNTEIRTKLGSAYLRTGDLDKAIEQTELAVQLDPLYAFAIINLAGMYATRGEFDRAEAVYERAIEVAPSMWETYLAYGDYLLKRRRYSESVSLFQQAYQMKPQDMLWQRIQQAAQYAGLVFTRPSIRHRSRRVGF